MKAKHSPFGSISPVFEEFIAVFNEMMTKHAPPSDRLGLMIRMKGKEMWLEACFNGNEDLEKIPEEIRTVLLKTEQSAAIDISLGASPIELIDRFEGKIKGFDFGTAALKGANISLKLKYLNCLKEVVQKMAPNEAFPILVAAGTKVRFSGSLGLNFDNVEELRQHPMFGKIADMKLENIMPVPLAELLSYETDLSGLSGDTELELRFGNAVSKLL